MKKNRSTSVRRHITLLELLVVIALIAVSASLFGTRLYHTMQNRRLRATEEMVTSRLELARQLSLYREEPVTVVITSDSLTMENRTLPLKIKEITFGDQTPPITLIYRHGETPPGELSIQ